MATNNRDWQQHIIPCAIRIHADLTQAAAGVAATLRQIHYQLLSAPEMLGLPEWERYNGSRSDQVILSRNTAKMRRAGTFPAVSEPGRWMRLHPWDKDAGEAIRGIEFHANRYRDLLDANIFIGCEKAAIVTQLMQWFNDPYHIPVVPLGGNGSQTIVDEAVDYAIRVRNAYDRPNVMFYAGDFDAKGFDIQRDFMVRAAAAFDPENVIRVAMRLGQKRANPQWWLKGKPHDTSVGWFFELFGDEAYYDVNDPWARDEKTGLFLQNRRGERLRQPVQVEVDALAPADLRQAFVDGIREFTDLPDIATATTEFEQEQEDKIAVLADLADRYSLDELRELGNRIEP